MPAAEAQFEIRPHPTKGRALHSRDAHRPGDIIATIEPLLLVPSVPHVSTLCAYCLRSNVELRACSRCRSAYYCDAACQKSHWTTVHGKECKALKKVAAQGQGSLPTPVQALLQALVKDDWAPALEKLEGHVESWSKTDKWKDFELMAMGACAFTGKGTDDDEKKRATEYMCKIQTNAFHRHDTALGEYGVFLEPTLAMMNHSCIPNAFVHFVGRLAVVRAERHIEAGGEIEISYTDYTNPLYNRKDMLAPYKFECSCPRCIGDLNVYQVCAQSPHAGLNHLSLACDLTQLSRHRAVVRPRDVTNLTARALELLQRIGDPDEELGQGLPPAQRKPQLQKQYRACQSLLDGDLWAVAPVPQLLNEISVYYSAQEDFASSLAVACLMASESDPIRYVAPFLPARLIGLLTIAKLLANTAADTASLNSSLKTLGSRADVNQKMQESLQEIDQVSLCQMILLLVLRHTPEQLRGGWQISFTARQILDEITQLPGREQETKLINDWNISPTSDASKAFFDYAVLQQVRTMAQIGKAILAKDFAS